jgi:hypothetical protein
MMDSFLGMDFDALIVGLMAATFTTFWLQTIDNIPKAMSAISFSAMLASFGGPVVSVYLASQFPSLSQVSSTLPLLIAVIIGGSVTWGFPILINFVRNKWGNNA